MIYKTLINCYYDQNDLFIAKPTSDNIQFSLSQERNLAYCDLVNCQPHLFYDFFSQTNVSVDDAKKTLSNIKVSWVIENYKQDDFLFQSLLNAQIYSVVPYGFIVK